MSFRENATAILKNYLCERKIQTQVNNAASKVISINKGVPQGFLLGRLLYVLYVNNIQRKANIQ